MKKTLAFMVMALALLLTQCKKPSIDFPTPSVTTTVSMTITAGPGSKTDITTEGGIVWSENDKIYVGDGSKYVGCLSIVSGVGNATGTFTGDVTVATGDDCTFHFYYLGNAKDYSTDLASHNTSVEVDFSSQDIHADGRGNLTNASGQHVGYGKAEHVKVEADKPVTGLQVSMKSKVAIAYFCFQKGEGESATPYEDALTLRGDHIYNKMTVYFNTNTNDFDFRGEKGDIRLADGHSERYAMLVPAGTDSETLNFGGAYEGTTTLANGIEANKFYRVDGSMPIVVTVEEVKPFTVGMDNGKPRRVEFAPGNLWADATDAQHPVFYFEANQWDTEPTAVGQTGKPFSWNSSHVSHFKWSDAKNAVTIYDDCSGELFCNDNFTVDGDSHTDWRTLSKAEWSYLIGESSPGRDQSLRKWSKVYIDNDKFVNGLIIMPDGWQGTLEETTNFDSWQSLASSGAVFLPAAGVPRLSEEVRSVGAIGGYWSSSSNGLDSAYDIGFTSDFMYTDSDIRLYGMAVRLVR